MDKLSQAQAELREMDALAAEDSPVHRLHPLCKLIVTIVYIAAVVSFPKYDFNGLMVMVLYVRVCFHAKVFATPWPSAWITCPAFHLFLLRIVWVIKSQNKGSIQTIMKL